MIKKRKLKDDLVKELVDKPYGASKTGQKRNTTIVLPLNVYNNLSKKVFDAKISGKKGVTLSSLILEKLKDYNT